MTACNNCKTRLQTARYIVDTQQTLCSGCVDSDALHSEMWPTCPAAWHQPLDHLTDIQFNGSSAL